MAQSRRTTACCGIISGYLTYGSQRAVARALAKSNTLMNDKVRSSDMQTVKNSAWYAVRVKSRHEASVASHLDARGFEFFLPLYTSRRRWSDRFKEIKLPLFPGYVFCHFDPSNRFPVVSVPGVVHIVGIGQTAVEPAEINAIQSALKAGLPSEPWPYLQVGSKVRVECGPLCGLEGILLGFRGNHRLVLSVTLLQRSVAVQVEERWVRATMATEGAVRERVTAKPAAAHLALLA
jgi:transcription antitermination factor NusG